MCELRCGRNDFVVFFCGKQAEGRTWDYFYIGVRNVGRLLTRESIWADDGHKAYRQFFNVLARPINGVLQQHETIHKFHPDWSDRADAPYIVFDTERTGFRLRDPLHVATYEPARDDIEQWRNEEPRVARLANLILPSQPTTRGLRSTNPYRSHPKMNLQEQAERLGSYEHLRDELLALVET